jgi:thiol-disulfide isomerase/thioredoxin
MGFDMTIETIKASKHALAVYITSPENEVCQKFEPVLKQAAQQFAGKIELLSHIVTGSDDVLRELFILETPTVVVFNHGRELARLGGYQPLEAVQGLFEIALEAPNKGGLHLSLFDRLIRMMVGTAILFFGYLEEQSWIIMGLGVLLILMAFVDHFPAIYQKLGDWKAGFTKQ